MIIGQAIIGGLAVILLALTFSPFGTAALYLFARPLVQPYAALGCTFAGVIPAAGVLSLIVCASALFSRLWRARYIIFTGQLLPLYLLLYFCTISLLHTPSHAISLAHALKIFTGIALFILILNAVKSEADIDRLLWIYLLSAVIPMIYGYYQFVTATGHAWKGPYYAGRRIDSLLMEYNAYGEFLCITICAALMLFFRQKTKKKRLIVGILFISLLINLLLAMNRGSWICLLFALMAAALFYRKKVSLPLLLGLSLTALLLASPVIYNRFMELTLQSEWGGRNTYLGRISAWKILMPVILNHPFTGNGIGAIQLITERELGRTIVPHNDYVRLLAEGGIFALLSYIWFHGANLYLYIVKYRYQAWQMNYPMLVAALYFVTLSFFQNIIQNVVVFPMFTGLLAMAFKANSIAYRGVDNAGA